MTYDSFNHIMLIDKKGLHMENYPNLLYIWWKNEPKRFVQHKAPIKNILFFARVSNIDRIM